MRTKPLALLSSLAFASLLTAAQGWAQEPKIAAPAGWAPKTVAYLKASNTRHDYQFGASVALSADGSTLAVGSINESSGAKGVNGNQADHSKNDAGAVYVFTRKNGVWAQQAYIKASNPKEAALFGNAVALSSDGNTLAVGAYLENSGSAGVNGNQADASADGAGAVYVFTRTGTNWAQQAYIKASNPAEGDQFGFSVALSGDGNTLAAGAIEEASRATGVNGDQKDRGAPGTGAVYVYSRSGTSWTQQAYLKPDGPGGLFGYSAGLSGDGNTLAIGAEDAMGGGFVYVFARNGGAWSRQARFNAVNGENGDNFGWSVAISADGNTIVAGANDEDSLLSGVHAPQDENPKDAVRDTWAGAAYVFTRQTGGGWTEQAFLKPINTRKNDQFGNAVAISADGNTVAVGSLFGAGPGGSKGTDADPNDDSVSASGSVYVYTHRGGSWTAAAYVKAPNARASAQFGNAVALSADGRTLAVGSSRETSAAKGINGNQADKSAPDAGAVYVFY